MCRYLQDNQYYIDLYDIYTIEKCLDWYRNIRDGLEEKRNTEEYKKLGKEEFGNEVSKIASYMVNFIKAIRYRHKKETIQKWMDRDRKKQKKFDDAMPPHGVLCKECFSQTEIIFKDLHYPYEENGRVLFMFECPKCKKRQALYEDGSEWLPETYKCPECNSPLNVKYTNVKNVLTIIYSCPNCSYKKEDVDDFNELKKVREVREARENKLLAEHRKEFCDDKTGEEMLRFY